MQKKPFYITTTLPYVNAEPHIGFAMEIIRADIIARIQTLSGQEVFFNTGTDEHGMKILEVAKRQGVPTKEYVDSLSKKYRDVLPKLGIMNEINFVRTTDEKHRNAAMEFWKVVDKNGFIYKRAYSVKYCVGCELEKTESELANGRCPLHPLTELELIEEENYFFKFSEFTDKLSKLYEENQTFVVPDFRYNEIKSFVKRGLEDFSISRLSSKMPWGIPVPGDESQVMYVWFDALVNYISTIGWPHDMESFNKWWIESGGVVQYCGKDNLRQQASMWQAMLLAAGLPTSKTIVIDGFITGEGGVKMSKSLGNTVDPLEIINNYGTDALRYFVAREIHPFEDSPFTMERFAETYNASLANGIGNLTSRILKMAKTNEVWLGELPENIDWDKVSGDLSSFDINAYTNSIWTKIMNADKYVAEKAPFKLIKDDRAKGEEALRHLLVELWTIANMLLPIMPSTAKTILDLIKNKEAPSEPLFLRK